MLEDEQGYVFALDENGKEKGARRTGPKQQKTEGPGVARNAYH